MGFQILRPAAGTVSFVLGVALAGGGAFAASEALKSHNPMAAGQPAMSRAPAAEAADPPGAGDFDPRIFDNSERFVPPSELPLKSTPKARSGEVAPDVLMERLQSKVLSRDGTVRNMDVDPELKRRILENIRRLEEQKPRSDKKSDAGQLVPKAKRPVSRDLKARSREHVIGTDDRNRVTDTRSYPFSTIGMVATGCSGTMIGKKHVLTAAHCVYNIKTNKWYSQLHFWAGRNGSSAPFGTANWQTVIAPVGFTDKHEFQFDYAVIVLQSELGNTVGWLGYGYEEPMPHYSVNITGYPADKSPTATMWHSFCAIQDVTEGELYYDCDIAGGMSGSGVYTYFTDNDNRVIYGVQSLGRFGKAWNSGPRINQARFESIKSWVESND